MIRDRVSVIIPARNSARTIGICLDSVARQTHRAIDVIVVDNGSTDETQAIARSRGARVVVSGGRTPSARNAGARATTGELLLHLDSDMELHPHSVAQCVDAVSRGAGIVILPERNIASGYWMNAFSFNKQLFRGVPGFENGRFVTRSWFDAVGGYDETLWEGEDRDFFLRAVAAGARVGSIEAVTKHHIEHLSIQDILHKTAAYTRTRGAFMDKHGTKVVSRRASTFNLLCLRWRLFIKSPLTAAGWVALNALFVARDTVIMVAARRPRSR